MAHIHVLFFYFRYILHRFALLCRHSKKTTVFSSSCLLGNSASIQDGTVRHPTVFLWIKAVSRRLSRLLSTLVFVFFVLESEFRPDYHFLRLSFLLPLVYSVSFSHYFCLNNNILGVLCTQVQHPSTKITNLLNLCHVCGPSMGPSHFWISNSIY